MRFNEVSTSSYYPAGSASTSLSLTSIDGFRDTTNGYVAAEITIFLNDLDIAGVVSAIIRGSAYSAWKNYNYCLLSSALSPSSLSSVNLSVTTANNIAAGAKIDIWGYK
jgi:hypothetical protein